MFNAAPLFARERELNEIDGALAGVLTGAGRVLLLSGEPGIGKTRLCEELARRAAEQDANVRCIWGRASELGDAPPYWCWTQAVRALLGDPLTAGAVASVLASNPALSLLLPERRQPPPAVGERFALFDAVVEVLRSSARLRPLVLLLDDLHACDRGSLELLLMAARELRTSPVLLMGTHRDADARMRPEVSALLSSVAREGRRLELRRLQLEHVAQLMRAVSGAEPHPQIVQAVYRASEGNPLCLDEVVRLLMMRGGGSDPILANELVTDVMREAISRNALALPPEVRETLDAAAVIGRDGALSLLATLSGMSPPQLEERLRPAVTAGLLSLDRSADRFRFSHVLIQNTLYEQLKPERRESLHAASLEALQLEAKEAEQLHLSERARHALAQSSPHAQRTGADLAIRAGRAAVKLLAFDEAAEYFQKACNARSRAGDVDGEAWCERLLELASAQIRAGALKAGKATCLEVSEVARRLRLQLPFARAVLQYGSELQLGNVDPGLIALLEEALQRLGPADAALHAQLTARLAAALQPAADPEGPVRLAREAVEEARRTGDEAALLRVLHFARSAFLPADDLEARWQMDTEMIALADRLAEPVLALAARGRLITVLFEQGDIPGVERQVHAYEAAAERFRQPHYRAMALLHRASLSLLRGQFAQATEFVDDAALLGEGSDDPMMATTIVFHRLSIAQDAHRFEEVEKLIGELGARLAGQPGWQMLRGLVTAQLELRRGSPDRAREAYSVVDLSRVPDRFAGWAMAAEVIAGVGSQKEVERALRILRPRIELCDAVGAFAKACTGSNARAVALLEERLGNTAQANAAFERATARNSQLGADGWLARTLADHAAALARRGTATQLESSAAMASRARTIAQTLGMPGLLQAASAPEAAPSPQPVSPRPGPTLSLRRDGELWLLEDGEATLRLKDSKGLQLLAELLRQPAREFHVLELIGGSSADSVRDGGDSGELLDREALDAYRQRMAELREELEEAEQWNDAARATRGRRELEALEQEIARAVGLGGRVRRAGGSAERARVNVQRRIADALRRIEELAPELGAHLRKAIRTGTFCSYQPLVRTRTEKPLSPR